MRFKEQKVFQLSQNKCWECGLDFVTLTEIKFESKDRLLSTSKRIYTLKLCEDCKKLLKEKLNNE